MEHKGLRLACACLMAGAVSYGAVSLPPPTPFYGAVGDGVEGFFQRQVDAGRKWVQRHPSISGAIAGGIAGTTIFPGIGTIGGIVAGATVGATVANDERGARKEEREIGDAPKADEPAK